MAGVYRLAVRSGFSAAHALTGAGTRCENLHGHNYGVEAVVEGRELDASGMLVDFGDLKRELARVLEDLDHANLNEVPALGGQSPSSENLARHIHQALAGALSRMAGGRNARLVQVTVTEKTAQSATYFEVADEPGEAG
jgi:6-pyruvoyltetrahydropterin/6-carboxytetrahydropterin synthase